MRVDLTVAHLVQKLAFALVLVLVLQLRPSHFLGAQAQNLGCAETSKIKTHLQAIEYVKRTVIDVSDYVKRPDWQETFHSEAYRDVRPVGRLVRGTGWLIGEIKDDATYYFGVDFSYQGSGYSTALFAEVNTCGHVRDSGFLFDLQTTQKPKQN